MTSLINNNTKTVHIVRHGKALQDYRCLQDCDRPLIEKGIVNNETAARQLRIQYAAPDLVISSHAVRALHTAHIFARIMVYPHNRVQVNEKLYMEGENEALNILKDLPDEIGSVMLVGHNPDVTYLAHICTRQNMNPIPTSGVVTICFETDKWSQIENVKTKFYLLGLTDPVGII